MTKMSTIYSRLSYGTGATLAGGGVSAKAYAAKTAADSAWLIEKIAGLTLSDWAIIIGIACTVVTCGVNWHYRRKEYQLKLRGGDTA
ncbi:HP1 family phage holin [Pectobacterium versatile]|uniref:HP1 family phage holin n=1 Tax=Pectobacterium versatile TaxID=2488639 RepID=UPI00382606B4